MLSCRTSTMPALLAAVTIAAAACEGAADGPAGDARAWKGTVTTEGDVTTIRNQSGSVWRGTARLVEDLSIGVDIGDDPYMFGAVGGIWATDERIYVPDYQAPAVRVFDADGRYIMDIGREGQGPGEYQSPGDVLVSEDGLIYVRDSGPGGPISVFTESGEVVDTLRGDPMFSSAWPMVMTPNGKLYTPVRADRGAGPADGTQAMGEAGPNGIVGEPIAVPTLGFEWKGVRVNERMVSNVPFAPYHTWAMAPSGAIVAGINGEYRFEIHEPSGHVIVVEKAAEREPVGRDEAEWYRRSTIRYGRNFEEAWSWDGAEIPALKPSYSNLTVDAGGRIWVSRRGQPTRGGLRRGPPRGRERPATPVLGV